jgi:TetR/AcrR family transcriptional regulator, transcriptional repressor for nem operon
MARPRAFDEPNVLEQAMRLFWQRGYGGVSFADLEAATGILRTSIYAAYGDKEGFFIAVVDHYNVHYSAQLRAALRAPATAWAGLEEYFARLLSAFADPALPLGCLVTNVAVEGDRGQSRLGRRIAASIALAEDAFLESFGRAQARGELLPDADPRSLARHLVAVTHGLSVLAKASGDAAVLNDVVASTLAALRPLFRAPADVFAGPARRAG